MAKAKKGVNQSAIRLLSYQFGWRQRSWLFIYFYSGAIKLDNDYHFQYGIQKILPKIPPLFDLIRVIYGIYSYALADRYRCGLVVRLLQILANSTERSLVCMTTIYKCGPSASLIMLIFCQLSMTNKSVVFWRVYVFNLVYTAAAWGKRKYHSNFRDPKQIVLLWRFDRLVCQIT